MSLQDYLAKNYGTEKKKKKKHIRGAAVTIVDRTADSMVMVFYHLLFFFTWPLLDYAG